MIEYDFVKNKEVILSNHDNDNLDIFIPAVKRSSKYNINQIIVKNRRGRSIKIPKDFVISEVGRQRVSSEETSTSEVEDEKPLTTDNPGTPKFPPVKPNISVKSKIPPDKTDFLQMSQLQSRIHL